MAKAARGGLRVACPIVWCQALKRAQGLHSWVVMDDDLNEYASYEALMRSGLPAVLKKRWQPSMWPPSVQQRRRGSAPTPPPLERCLRMLPHLANMGGFFVALLRKVKPLPSKALVGATVRCSEAKAASATTTDDGDDSDEETDGDARGCGGDGDSDGGCSGSEGDGGDGGGAELGVVTGSAKAAQWGALMPLPCAVLKSLRKQLQLRKSIRELRPRLLCRSETATVVSYVASPLRQILAKNGGRRGGLRIFSAGFRLARRSRRGTFQLTVEGARALAPHIKKARTLRPSLVKTGIEEREATLSLCLGGW